MPLKFKFSGLVLALAAVLAPALADAQALPTDTRFFTNPSGRLAAFSGASTTGRIDENQPFFQQIGRQFGGNNRACATCHRPDHGWSLTLPQVQTLFNNSNGLHQLFLPIDGTNAPNMDRSTLEARRRASSLLLNKGLIRIPIPIRSTSEFTLVAVTVPQDGSFPADFAQAAVNTQVLSLYRRPPAVSNLAFLTDLMWDGRQNVPGQPMSQNLLNQTLGAARGHFGGNIPPFEQMTAEQRAQFQSIVNFETNLFSAQIQDNLAGLLDADSALGGPLPLFSPPAAFFEGGVFNLYTPWGQSVNAAQQSVQRGEALFNSRVFNTGRLAGQATCSSCHSNRGVGGNLASQRFNLNLSNPDLSIAGVRLNAPLPIYTLRRKTTGETVRTTDPGRILVSGTWGTGDGDSFKPPILRGLAARAPYFHGGQGLTLPLVVRFYNSRFAIGLTAAQQQDLVNFLASL